MGSPRAGEQAAEKGPSAALARSRGAATYVLSTPRASHRAPPCIWTFLSSLGENESFSSLLDPGVDQAIADDLLAGGRRRLDDNEMLVHGSDVAARHQADLVAPVWPRALIAVSHAAWTDSAPGMDRCGDVVSQPTSPGNGVRHRPPSLANVTHQFGAVSP